MKEFCGVIYGGEDEVDSDFGDGILTWQCSYLNLLRQSDLSRHVFLPARRRRSNYPIDFMDMGHIKL